MKKLHVDEILRTARKNEVTPGPGNYNHADHVANSSNKGSVYSMRKKLLTTE